MTNYSEYSNAEIIGKIGERYRDYRILAQLTQQDVEHITGVSKNTIQRFETRRATNISMGTLLLLLKAIGKLNNIDELLPELPVSPYLFKDNNQPKRRVRHSK